jgi:hypothetical protein
LYGVEMRVTDYRIYRLDSAGRIVWGRDFTCATDQEALAEAEVGLTSSEKAEVWAGTRFVGLAFVSVELSQAD